MLTDAQVYCMTSTIYLFRPSLPLKSFIGKRRKQSCTPNNMEITSNVRDHILYFYCKYFDFIYCDIFPSHFVVNKPNGSWVLPAREENKRADATVHVILNLFLFIIFSSIFCMHYCARKLPRSIAVCVDCVEAVSSGCQQGRRPSKRIITKEASDYINS